jgi:hypothetical protein
MTASISGGGLDFWPRNPASNKAPRGAKRVPVAAPMTPASAISAAAVAESPGQHRGDPRVQVGLPRQRGIQRLKLLGRLGQQCRGVAARGGEHDLPAQQGGASLLELIQRPRRRHGEQPGRRIRRAGRAAGNYSTSAVSPPAN